MRLSISPIKKVGVAAFWLCLWELAAAITANSIILVGPIVAFGRLFELAATANFWQSLNFSLMRILLGFALSLIAGILLAVCCALSAVFKALVVPMINIIKTIPVVSFALLAMMWLSPAYLSVFIAFVTVVPIIFFNTVKGIENANYELLQMAAVFRVSRVKRVRYVYVPAILPFVISAAESGLGFAWKAAIAGEVISMGTRASIGGNLHMARVFLMTADLFAWTIAIVLMSFFVERLFFLFFKRVKR